MKHCHAVKQCICTMYKPGSLDSIRSDTTLHVDGSTTQAACTVGSRTCGHGGDKTMWWHVVSPPSPFELTCKSWFCRNWLRLLSSSPYDNATVVSVAWRSSEAAHGPQTMPEASPHPSVCSDLVHVSHRLSPCKPQTLVYVSHRL